MHIHAFNGKFQASLVLIAAVLDVSGVGQQGVHSCMVQRLVYRAARCYEVL